MDKSFDEVAAAAAEQGITGLTNEEYTANVKAGRPMATILRRIGNARDYTEKEESKEKVDVVGWPVGGRDKLYKPKGSDEMIAIENAKVQRVLILTEDGEWDELEMWGEFEGIHGKLTELGVEVTTSTSGDRTYTNRTIREVGPARDPTLHVGKLMKMCREVDDLGESDLRQIVVVKGRVLKFDAEDKWEGGHKTGEDYPLNYNDVPCLQFRMRGPEGKVDMRVRLAPTKFGKPLIQVPEFDDLKDTNDLKEYNVNYGGCEMVAVGWVSRYDPQDAITYMAMYANAVFDATDAGEAKGEKSAPAKPTEQATVPAEETPAPAPPTGDGTSSAASKLKTLRAAVAEGYDALGSALDLGSFKELAPDIVALGISDETIEKVIVKLVAEKTA